ncbi:type IV pilin protein [Vibrio sp. Isolate23]|uniref:type IV pilin protein n=1 Tax=Vibrio sp. Isolate23 TaxID=2908533 RepID=UPI001EFCD3E0|nr:type IV pilin protein [Vibrio sp. Isolate23]
MFGENRCNQSKQSLNGMTLLELLVVTVVIVILSAIAYPSYLDFVRQSHRTTAISDLARIQLALESNYSGQYQWSHIVSEGQCTLCLSDQNRFIFSITSGASTAYTIKATAQTSSQQHLDTCLIENNIDYISLDAKNIEFPASCWE